MQHVYVEHPTQHWYNLCGSILRHHIPQCIQYMHDLILFVCFADYRGLAGLREGEGELINQTVVRGMRRGNWIRKKKQQKQQEHSRNLMPTVQMAYIYI